MIDRAALAAYNSGVLRAREAYAKKGVPDKVRVCVECNRAAGATESCWLCKETRRRRARARRKGQ